MHEGFGQRASPAMADRSTTTASSARGSASTGVPIVDLTQGEAPLPQEARVQGSDVLMLQGQKRGAVVLAGDLQTVQSVLHLDSSSTLGSYEVVSMPPTTASVGAQLEVLLAQAAVGRGDGLGLRQALGALKPEGNASPASALEELGKGVWSTPATGKLGGVGGQGSAASGSAGPAPHFTRSTAEDA